MGNQRHWWAAGLFFLLFLGAGIAWAAFESAERPTGIGFDGRAQLDHGSIRFEASFSPGVAQVGDEIVLNLTLLNDDDDPLPAVVDIQLPPTLQVDVGRLRTGVNFNFQNRRLSWQPVVNGGGGAGLLQIPLTVIGETPEMPEQPLPITLSYRGESYAASALLWIGTPPTAAFSISPPRAAVGQPIQLQAQVGGSGPHKQIWSLGDGRTVPANNPLIVYPSRGTYTVELQVSNPLSSETHRETVVIVPEPAAFFRPSDTAVAVNQEISFTSQSGGEQPLDYIWDFGDGTFANSANPTHRYEAPGAYNVVLTVRNAYGQAQNYVTIQVGSPPVADAILPAAAVAGQPITGQAFVDDQTLSIIWDMGDGSRQEGEVIAHTFRLQGDFVVTMNAANHFGNTAITRLVRVNGGSFSIYLPAVANQDGTITILPDGSAADIVAQTIEFVDNEADIILEANPELDGLPPSAQLLWYINEARRQADVGPVANVPALNGAAKAHTDDMATARFTGHAGSDGSRPYERIARSGYREGGYAGEATAWGFRAPHEAVQFWLDSPPHRAILLNPLADQVGVGQTVNFNAPSIWYWTAEFASTRGSIESQMFEAGVRQERPAVGASYAFTETAIFTWSWPLPLTEADSFVVYIRDGDGGEQPVAAVREPIDENRPFEYGVSVGATGLARQAGDYGWLVRLERRSLPPLTQSELRLLTLTGRYPTPIAQPTSTPPPLLPTATLPPAPISSPTPPSLPPSVPPTATPLNTGSTLPTATATQVATPTATPSPPPSPTPLPSPTPTSSLPTVGTQPTVTPSPTP